MILMNQKQDKILELMFEYPSKGFAIREISKKTRIPSSSVQRYLKKLQKEGLITKENTAIITPYFKILKTFFMINKLFRNDVLEYLYKKLFPSVIIVFGSVRKGEYDHKSDIDLFLETTKKEKIDLANFEKKLGHKIQLFIEQDINNLPPNLFNSVVNGIKLMGYFKVK